MPATRERGLRADARRNVAAILDAALVCLARDPDASVADIAAAAGLGRMTVYGHFPSRTDLVDAAFAHAVAESDRALEAVDLTGDARDALRRLVASSWRIVDRHRDLLLAAQHTLEPERIRDLHQRPLRRVETLIDRGRRDRVFRTDLPTSWLVAIFYNVLHGAADEIAAGRLAEPDASSFICATLLAAFAAGRSRVDDERTVISPGNGDHGRPE